MSIVSDYNDGGGGTSLPFYTPPTFNPNPIIPTQDNQFPVSPLGFPLIPPTGASGALTTNTGFFTGINPFDSTPWQPFSGITGMFQNIFGGLGNISKWVIPALIMIFGPKLLAKIPFIRRYKRWIPILIGLYLLYSNSTSIDPKTKQFVSSPMGQLALATPSMGKVLFPFAALTGGMGLTAAAIALAGTAFATYRTFRGSKRRPWYRKVFRRTYRRK